MFFGEHWGKADAIWHLTSVGAASVCVQIGKGALQAHNEGGGSGLLLILPKGGSIPPKKIFLVQFSEQFSLLDETK